MCCRAGKTSVAVGLQHLFRFGHIQSDDITSKKAAPIFIQHVTQALKKHYVVIADKCIMKLDSQPTGTQHYLVKLLRPRSPISPHTSAHTPHPSKSRRLVETT